MKMRWELPDGSAFEVEGSFPPSRPLFELFERAAEAAVAAERIEVQQSRRPPAPVTVLVRGRGEELRNEWTMLDVDRGGPARIGQRVPLALVRDPSVLSTDWWVMSWANSLEQGAVLVDRSGKPLLGS